MVNSFGLRAAGAMDMVGTDPVKVGKVRYEKQGGGFASEDRAELLTVERLRTFAATGEEIDLLRMLQSQPSTHANEP
jgi:hypothetical protein